METLPRKQRQILEFIRTHHEREGVPPTYREIALHFGVTISTIQEAIAALIHKGALERVPGKSRGLRVVEDVVHTPATVPIVGLTAAGPPALALEHIEGHLTIDGSLFPEPKLFALRVHGDSMIEDGIFHGDYAIIARRAQVETGEIALALIDDEETTIKRIYPRGDKVELRPANRDMAPMIYDARRVRIQGKVVGLCRKMG
ncbi:MAG TPA: transcriptional repressor LexA [bacterium]|nr:transcriptional repressor LexA [bacterium]